MLKVPLHCSFKLDLHELWSKEGVRIKFEIWLPTTNPLKAWVKWSPIGTCYTPFERYFQGLWDIIVTFSKNTWSKKDMNVQNFRRTKVPFLGLPLGSPREKWDLDVIPTDKYIIYYREGSGASSQKLQVVWSLCLRLSLLSPLHHLHSTYTNCPLFLVVRVDLILNFRLWVRPNPILEL